MFIQLTEEQCEENKLPLGTKVELDILEEKYGLHYQTKYFLKDLKYVAELNFTDYVERQILKNIDGNHEVYLTLGQFSDLSKPLSETNISSKIKRYLKEKGYAYNNIIEGSEEIKINDTTVDLMFVVGK